ncbi:MAG: hypothetical protein ACKVJU_24805 [Verrucomicrobiales bacterium]
MRSLGVNDFANDLKISRDTVKRLFERGVFPEEWVWKTTGGHWRVEVDEARLPLARELYQQWKVVSRKPNASRSRNFSQTVQKLVATIFEVRILGEPVSRDRYDEYEAAMLTEEAGKLFRKYLENFKEMKGLPEYHALYFVVEHLWKLRSPPGLGPTYLPSKQEIAEAMDMSVASIYRRPFGKNIIKKAANFLNAAVSCSTAEIEQLALENDEELSVELIQRKLVVSESVAIEHFEEWKRNGALESSDPESEDSPAAYTYSEPDQSFFDESKGSTEAKKTRMNELTRKKRQFILQWESGDLNGERSVFLKAVPRYEFEEIEKERKGEKRKRQLSSTHLQKMANTLEQKTVNLGCVTELAIENGPLFRIFELEYSFEKSCETLEDGIEKLIDEIQKHFDESDDRFDTDWEQLRSSAPI